MVYYMMIHEMQKSTTLLLRQEMSLVWKSIHSMLLNFGQM